MMDEPWRQTGEFTPSQMGRNIAPLRRLGALNFPISRYSRMVHRLVKSAGCNVGRPRCESPTDMRGRLMREFYLDPVVY